MLINNRPGRPPSVKLNKTEVAKCYEVAWLLEVLGKNIEEGDTARQTAKQIEVLMEMYAPGWEPDYETGELRKREAEPVKAAEPESDRVKPPAGWKGY